jgi:5-methylcytosine-specific restriction endonuclease McrA
MQTEFTLVGVKIELTPLNQKEQAIHDLALSRAGQHADSESALLSSIEEVDRLRLYEKFGLPNISQYCRQYLKLSDTLTGFFVGVARKARVVPELKDAIEQGELSVSTAIQVVGVITEQNQTEWVEKAKELTKRELEKEVAKARPHKKKKPRLKPVGENRNRIEFEASDEFVSLLRRAQDLESQRTSRAATLEETLQTALEGYLDRQDPLRKAERAEKRKNSQPLAAPDLSQEKSAEVKPRRPPLTASMRHEINLRDHGQCQTLLPGGKRCGRSRWLSFHHRVPLSHGGRNEVANIATVCGACHSLLHEVETLTI